MMTVLWYYENEHLLEYDMLGQLLPLELVHRPHEIYVDKPQSEMIRICNLMCLYVCVCTCVCVCACACMYVYARACMRVCVCAYTHACAVTCGACTIDTSLCHTYYIPYLQSPLASIFRSFTTMSKWRYPGCAQHYLQLSSNGSVE